MAWGDEGWTVADQEDADFTAFGSQGTGSVSVPGAPNPSSVMSDTWTDFLGNATKAVTAAGKSVGEIQAARDASTARNQDRSFNQMVRTSQLELDRARLQANTDLSKLSLASRLSNARAALALPGGSFLYPFVSGTASAGSYLVLAALAVGAYYVFKRMK